MRVCAVVAAVDPVGVEHGDDHEDEVVQREPDPQVFGAV